MNEYEWKTQKSVTLFLLLLFLLISKFSHFSLSRVFALFTKFVRDFFFLLASLLYVVNVLFSLFIKKARCCCYYYCLFVVRNFYNERFRCLNMRRVILSFDYVNNHFHEYLSCVVISYNFKFSTSFVVEFFEWSIFVFILLKNSFMNLRISYADNDDDLWIEFFLKRLRN